MKGTSIYTLQVGPLETNCYIVSAKGEALIIDPGDDSRKILEYLEERKLSPRYVINTHGHADHIGANGALKEAGAEILIHEEDAPMLIDPKANLSVYSGGKEHFLSGPSAHRLLNDGDTIEWAGPPLLVVHCPGHTRGGICLLMDGVLFSGDTLFAGGIGRTDLPGGDGEQIQQSIKSRLFTLPRETRVLPGHGPGTTIGYEISNNPFVHS